MTQQAYKETQKTLRYIIFSFFISRSKFKRYIVVKRKLTTYIILRSYILAFESSHVESHSKTERNLENEITVYIKKRKKGRQKHLYKENRNWGEELPSKESIQGIHKQLINNPASILHHSPIYRRLEQRLEDSSDWRAPTARRSAASAIAQKPGLRLSPPQRYTLSRPQRQYTAAPPAAKQPLFVTQAHEEEDSKVDDLTKRFQVRVKERENNRSRCSPHTQ